MPTYTYRCPSCLNSKDIKHKITEDPEILCECEDNPLMDRVITNVSDKVLYKGKNWPSKRGWQVHK